MKKTLCMTLSIILTARAGFIHLVGAGGNQRQWLHWPMRNEKYFRVSFMNLNNKQEAEKTLLTIFPHWDSVNLTSENVFFPVHRSSPISSHNLASKHK